MSKCPMDRRSILIANKSRWSKRKSYDGGIRTSTMFLYTSQYYHSRHTRSSAPTIGGHKGCWGVCLCSCVATALVKREITPTVVSAASSSARGVLPWVFEGPLSKRSTRYPAYSFTREVVSDKKVSSTAAVLGKFMPTTLSV